MYSKCQRNIKFNKTDVTVYIITYLLNDSDAAANIATSWAPEAI